MNSLETSQRQAVLAETREWLCTPYQTHGRIKGRQGGVDCAYFPAEVYRTRGLIPAVPDVEYASDWNLHRNEELYLAWVLKFAREIPGPPLPADLSLYQYGRTQSHGAIVWAWPRVIHAVVGRGVEWGWGDPMIIGPHRGHNLKFYRLSCWSG